MVQTAASELCDFNIVAPEMPLGKTLTHTRLSDLTDAFPEHGLRFFAGLVVVGGLPRLRG